MGYLFELGYRNFQKSSRSKVASYKNLLKWVNKKLKIKEAPKIKDHRTNRTLLLSVLLCLTFYDSLSELPFYYEEAVKRN